jgi:hypothetical protein
LQHNVGLGGAVVITLYKKANDAKSEPRVGYNPVSISGGCADRNKLQILIISTFQAVEARNVTDAEVQKASAKVNQRSEILSARL